MDRGQPVKQHKSHHAWEGPFVLVSLHPGESPIGPFLTKNAAEDYVEEEGLENHVVRNLMPPQPSTEEDSRERD